MLLHFYPKWKWMKSASKVGRSFILLLSIFLLSASASLAQEATIITDKEDYAPGSDVIITGSGFNPGESVRLQVLHEPAGVDNSTGPEHQPWVVFADASGNVSSVWHIPLEGDELGATLKLSANGLSSGFYAEYIFTDGNPPVPYVMSSGNYFEQFGDITNWTNNFASGIGTGPWGSSAVNIASGTIPDGIRITTATNVFVTGTSGGVQKGTGNIQLLSTGTTDNSTSCAIELHLNFSGRNAGNLSFDWASVNNSTGDRKSSLRIYTSTDGTTWTELTSAAVLNFTNNVLTSGSINVALPSSFTNSSTARIRFYYHNGSGGGTGSRPKISLDNVGVTSTAIVSATAGIYESYAIMNFGGSDVYYDLMASTSNPDFNGANLGTYYSSQSLYLDGAQNKTYKCSSPSDVLNGKLYYRIYPTGNTPGSFSAAINLPFLSNDGATGCGGQNQTWQKADAGVNLLSGLCDGNYTIEIYTSADINTGTALANNGGSNYKATFTVKNDTRSGIYESYIVLNTGSGNVFYDLQATTGNPDFNGANLGTFCNASSIIIAGGQNKVYKCSPNDITSGKLNYRLYSVSPSGSFTQINLGGVTDDGASVCGGLNQTWQNTTNSTNILTGLAPGTYTLEVYTEAAYTSNNGIGLCPGTHYSSNGGANYKATFVVQAPPTLSTVTTNVSCVGSNDGAINLTVSGATGSVTYLWSPGGATSEDLTGLTPGTYSVTVTTSTGCTATTSATINEPSAIVVSYTATPILCKGGSSTVTIKATGGTGAYTGTGTFTQVAGTQTYTVTDANNCSGSVTVTVTEPAELVLETSKTNVSCKNGNNGAINLTVNGGTPGVNITQNFNTLASSGTSSTVPAGWHFSESGNNANTSYTAGTGSSNTGDTYSFGSTGNGERAFGGLQSGTLNPFIGFAYTNTTGQTITSINVVYYGEQWRFGDNGRLVPDRLDFVYSTDATSLTTGTWIDVDGIDFIAPITTGTVGALDGNSAANRRLVGGTITGLNIPNGATVWVAWKDFNVSGSDDGLAIDDVSLSYVTGTPHYSYLWSNGATTEDISGLTAGTYSVTVTDANGCTASTSVTITEPDAIVVTAAPGTILCNGDKTSVVVSATGGTGVYTGTGTITNVGAGTYTYTVTDENGCSGSVTITISEPVALVASSSAGSILCNGGTTTVVVSATGGTAPYSGTGSFTVSAGSYTFTVTDANSCTSTTTGTVSEPAVLVASSSPGTILCNGGTTTVVVSATGGTAPYSGTGSFTVSAGSYTFTVTDANGCTSTTTGTVSEPAVLVASSSPGTILCNGGTTTVVVSATGGTAPYSGTGSFTVSAGSYTYTVTDANGCTSTTTGTVSEPAAIVVTATPGSIACNGGTTSVVVSATGGTGAYTGTGTITNVSAGTYTYSVTDENGCTGSTTITIGEPTALSASSVATVLVCPTGTATVTVSANGGTAPYSGTGNFVRGAGTHTFDIIDANGCTASTTITITATNVAPVINSVTPSTVAPIALGGSVSITTNYTDNNVVSASVNWDDGTANQNVSNPASTFTVNRTYANPGVYSVTVTLTDGCGLTTSFRYDYVVVYDPNGGFVTGGGWINSPAGAYVADASLTGKANFGFVAKYKKGTNIPDGNTEFQFHAGSFNFKSSAYDAGWLVISGYKATFRGTGTVNGAGNYGFLVSAIDGQKTGGGGYDKFRIKIWDKNNGNTVVYDNQMNAAENADATTVIAGGSIVIHEVKKNTQTNTLPALEIPTTGKFDVKVLGNPSITKFTLKLESSNFNDKITLKIVDISGRIVEVKQNLYSGQVVEFGTDYKVGSYFVEAVQGDQRKVIKLIKVSRD